MPSGQRILTEKLPSLKGQAELVFKEVFKIMLNCSLLDLLFLWFRKPVCCKLDYFNYSSVKYVGLSLKKKKKEFNFCGLWKSEKPKAQLKADSLGENFSLFFPSNRIFLNVCLMGSWSPKAEVRCPISSFFFPLGTPCFQKALAI